MEKEKTEGALSGGATVFSQREWGMLLASFLIACVVCFGFASLDWLPGIGVTGFVYACVGTALFSLRGQVRYTRANILLLIGGLLLAAVYGIFANEEMRLLNLPVVAATVMAALYHIAGAQAGELSCPAVLPDTALNLMRDAFAHTPKPFKALAGLTRKKPAVTKGLGTGLCISIPILAVVLALLASSDAVFGAGLNSLLKAVSMETLLPNAKKVGCSILLGLVLFSLLYALRHPKDTRRVHRRLPAMPVPGYAVVLTALNAVYALFVYVQFAYLFGGAGSAVMTGGWAQYARSGFFELVIIAVINLSVTLLSLSASEKHGIVRALCGMLLIMTGIILFSAARRMGLYIGEYGLSLLRLLTLWAAAVILIALLLTAVRLLKPGFPLFPALLAAAVSAWLAFNLSNPAARIAGWNATAYLRGSLQTVDTGYMSSLSIDALPALRQLSQQGHPGANEAIEAILKRGSPPWYAWSLPYRQWGNISAETSAGGANGL
jgi:hypothetical protein